MANKIGNDVLKGATWYNDGIQNYIFKEGECIPENLIKGKLTIGYSRASQELIEDEIWKDIDFLGEYGIGYQVSNMGRVKGVHGRIMKCCSGANGYQQLNLHNKTFFVHRLVAQAFIPNPNNYNEINHIDENKENCKASNLEWVTHQQNLVYGTRCQRVSDLRKKWLQTEKGIEFQNRLKTILKTSENKKTRGTTGLIWITDGCINKYIKPEDEIPEGFRRGFVKKKKIEE